MRPDGTPSGTLRRRVESAFAAAGGRDDARFLVTGGICPHPPAEAEVMRILLRDLGVTDDRIVVEPTARNTLQSAVRCSAILRDRDDVGAVVVCSSRYHIVRCRMLLRLNGVRTHDAVASRDAHRVGAAGYAWHWARDLAALPWDAVAMTGWRLIRKGRRPR